MIWRHTSPKPRWLNTRQLIYLLSQELLRARRLSRAAVFHVGAQSSRLMCSWGSTASASMIAWRKGGRAHEYTQVAFPWVYTWPTSICKCWKSWDSTKNPKLPSPQISIHLIISELHPIDCIRFMTPNMRQIWKIPFAKPVSIVIGKVKKIEVLWNSNQYVIVWCEAYIYIYFQTSLVIVCFIHDIIFLHFKYDEIWDHFFFLEITLLIPSNLPWFSQVGVIIYLFVSLLIFSKFCQGFMLSNFQRVWCCPTSAGDGVAFTHFFWTSWG